MLEFKFWYNVKSYIDLIKLKQTLLLVFTAFAAYYAAGGKSANHLIGGFLVLSVFLAVSGTTAVNMYFDADIDSLMERTQNRPLPSRRLTPEWKALLFGVIVLSVGIILSLYLVNVLVALIIFIGFIADSLLYTIILKRRTFLSVILGGIAGGMPALAGWVAHTRLISLGGVLLALLIITWIPSHIWNLAIYHFEDYKKAELPVFPVVFGENGTLKAIIVSNMLFVILSLSLYFLKIFGLVFLFFTLPPIALLSLGSVRLLIRTSRENARFMFKISGLCLFIIFLSMMIDKLL